MQEKKSKVAQELAAHQQQMRAGGLSLSQGTRRILQERQRHTMKASQAAAAMTASGLLNQVTATTLSAVRCCAVLRFAVQPAFYVSAGTLLLCFAVLCLLLCCALCCAMLQDALGCDIPCCTMQF